jgi:hypothetical protein
MMDPQLQPAASLSESLRTDRDYRIRFIEALRAHLQGAEPVLATIPPQSHPALRPSALSPPLVHTNDDCLLLLNGPYEVQKLVAEMYDPIVCTLPEAEDLESMHKFYPQKHQVMKNFTPPRYEIYPPPTPLRKVYHEPWDSSNIQCIGKIKPGELGYEDSKFLPDLANDPRKGTWLESMDGPDVFRLWGLGKRRDQHAERQRRKETQRRQRKKTIEIGKWRKERRKYETELGRLRQKKPEQRRREYKGVRRMALRRTKSEDLKDPWQEFGEREARREARDADSTGRKKRRPISSPPDLPPEWAVGCLGDPQRANERASIYSVESTMSGSVRGKKSKTKRLKNRMEKKLLRNLPTPQKINSAHLLTQHQASPKALPPHPIPAGAVPAPLKLAS